MAFPHTCWSSCNHILRALEKFIWPRLKSDQSSGFLLEMKGKMWKWWHFPWLYGLSCFSLYISRKSCWFKEWAEVIQKIFEGCCFYTCRQHQSESMRITGWWTLGWSEATHLIPYLMGSLKRDWGTFIRAHLFEKKIGDCFHEQSIASFCSTVLQG